VDFLAEEIPNALRESLDGLGRVTEIVRAMKDYAHPGTERGETDLNRALRMTGEVCRNEWKHVAVLELDLDPAAGLVSCYEGEVKQVVLNMLVNAAQAITEFRRTHPDAPFGRILVSSRRTAQEFLITVSDNGIGMDEHVRRHAFDPFFTTKEVGRGTGQGLALAHTTVVTKHHGRLEVDSTPGQGSTFTIALPLRRGRPAGP
jgi:signal transduction histidine kinase